MKNFAQRKNCFVMHCLNQGLILLAGSFFLSTSAGAQSFAYEGTITFLALSGKDCGGIKIGDSRSIKLAVEVQDKRVSGYSQMLGANPGRFSGDHAAVLTFEYPDMAQAAGHTIALHGFGTASLSGELRETLLKPDEAGCNLSHGQITAHQISMGKDAEPLRQEIFAAFFTAQEEYAAKNRDPQAYDEIMRLWPDLIKAETEGSENPEQAALLREQLQPLFEKVYGLLHLQTLNNLTARARLLKQLQRPDQALSLYEHALQIAEQNFFGQVAVLAYKLGDTLEKLDRKEAALAAFGKAVQADEKQYGPDHPEVAADLERQAQLLEAMQRQSQAIILYQRILNIREKTPDAKAEDIDHAHNQLARARDPQAYAKLEQLSAELNPAKASKDLKQAVALRQKMLPLAERCYGKFSYYLADLLFEQADNLETLSRDEEALALYPQTLEVMEASYGKEHGKAATTLNNFAYQYEKMGRYQEALPLYQRALTIREKAIGFDQPSIADSLHSLARLYKVLGQYDKALQAYKRSLAIREKQFGSNHSGTASSLNNLALLYQAMGQYTKAEPLLVQALAIYEELNGPEHSVTATSLHNLAGLYDDMGQYAKAEPLYVRALAIYEKSNGPEHSVTATSLNNLAGLYYAMGQYTKAEPLFVRALSIREKVLGSAHPDTATSLNNLAMLYKSMGQYARVESLYVRSLAILEEQLGPEHPDTARILNNLAVLYGAMYEYAKAEPLYVRALVIKEKQLGLDHPSTASSLGSLAVLYSAMRQYAKAAPLLVRALAVYEKVLGPDHPDTANSMNNLAFFNGVQQQPSAALPLLVRASTIIDRNLATTFPILNEQEKFQFVKTHEFEFHGMLSLIHRQLAGDQAAIRAGLNLVLSRKGIVFDAQARQQEAIARSLDPETMKLWDALSSQRSELAKLMQNKPEKMSGEDYQKRIVDYHSEIGKLEARIASKSALVAQELKQRKVTTKEVAQTLGKDGVLAEFVKIQDYDWEHGKWADTWRYLAFILHGDGKIQMVDLGEAGALESSVQAALTPIGVVGSNNNQQQAATHTLHEKLWQPIAAAVSDASKVVFSPDGLLNLVPFAALQDADGRYLIESRQISYVTSGRDLTKGDLGIKPESELYLAANPQFDLAAISTKAAATDEPTQGAVRSAGFGIHFSPLPGTAKEAKQIPPYLKGKQTVVTEERATEESVLAVRRPRVMHLSTHGFFLTDQIALTQGTRGFTRVKAAAQEETNKPAPVFAQGYENPLVRSGLAFAGANHAKEAQGGRDGVLTALEVSGMDLHGTDLVTLSACETGRGEVKSGEGVFGLRRAFALAGSRHLMMSLWPVSDAVTATQMQTFYQLYGKRTAPAAALRQAQLATIAELRSKRGQAEPALWAPFIVQGW